MRTKTLTIEPPKGVSLEAAKQALTNLKFKIVEEIDDDTEMSEEDFFSMIDEARAGKMTKVSREDMQKMLLE
jgi:hypothetical protein